MRWLSMAGDGMRLLQFAVALVFITAGALKLMSLSDPLMLDTWVMAVAQHNSTLLGVLAGAEILLGTALLWRVAPPVVIFIVAAAVAGVTVWSIVDRSLWARPCGCFGPHERFFGRGGWVMLARNTVVIVSLALVGWSARGRRSVAR